MAESIDEGLAGALSGKTVQPFVLKELDCSWQADQKPPRANAQFYYLGLRDGLPMVREFCVHLRRALVDFCLPRSEIRAAKDRYAETGDETVFYDLSAKARRLFIKAQQETKRSGEGGELILFNLLELIGAPQVVSKMYLKTAAQMPVHGSDGLHIGLGQSPNELVIYIGESKLHADYDNALGDALGSVTELAADTEKYQREFDLLTDHIDEEGLTASFLETLATYLNPYSSETINRKEAHACLIGFDYVDYGTVLDVDPTLAEAKFVELAKSFAEKKLDNLSKRLKKEKYNKLNFLFFFLPVPSVEEFRKSFNSLVLELGDAE